MDLVRSHKIGEFHSKPHRREVSEMTGKNPETKYVPSNNALSLMTGIAGTDLGTSASKPTNIIS